MSVRSEMEDECGRRCEGESGEVGVNPEDLCEPSVSSCLPPLTAFSTLWLASNYKMLTINNTVSFLQRTNQTVFFQNEHAQVWKIQAGW